MEAKRALTDSEVERLLDFIQPQKGIHPEIADSVVNMHKAKLKRQLIGCTVYPSILPKLKKKMQEMYEVSKIQAGESVGIITAQSFGQFQTQSTLNSFHKAGLSEKTVVSGVARFSEILDATRTPKGASCVVFFKEATSTLQDLKKLINHRCQY